MARTTSGAQFPFDAEPEVTLRNGKDAAETSSANEAPISLKASGGAYWQNHMQTFLDSAVVFHVTSLDTADTDETYALKVEVSTDEAFSAPIKVGEVVVTKTGTHVVNLYGPNIEQVAPNAEFIRVGLTAAGTTPSIEYYAWLAPVVGTGLR